MNDPSPPPSPRRALSLGVVASALTVLFAGIFLAVWPATRSKVGPRPMTSASARRVDDVYRDTPFENARPGVAYVGDAACTGCHREISLAYRSHPMGRSLAPVATTKEGPPTTVATGLPIEAKGVQYTIEHRDGSVFHKATRRGADGTSLAEVEAEVRFALGSGTRGVTFLIERGGFLFQSPIAWFAQERRWDISPGYGEFTTQPNFERESSPDAFSVTPINSTR